MCVCVCTRISQHKATLFSPSVGFLPSHLDRKAKPEFCWETEKCHGEVCVCVCYKMMSVWKLRLEWNSLSLIFLLLLNIFFSSVDLFSWTSCISWCAGAMARPWTWHCDILPKNINRHTLPFSSSKQPLVNIYIISLFQQEGPHKRRFSCSAEKSKELHFG